MRSYHVIECTKESPYVVQTIEYWDDLERMKQAMEESKAGPMYETYTDIANYTDITNAFPIMGEIKGSWTDDKLTIGELTATGRGF